MKTSVIFTTYNHPRWLEKVLWGFSVQRHRGFEVVVADDGSRDETRQLIEALRPQLPFPVRHVWQPDEGFQKCRILNKAIVQAEGEYLIFTDGDCIPRPDFVETHLAFADRGTFLSGGYVKLPMALSERIGREEIVSGQVFDLAWLTAHGLRRSLKTLKVNARGAWGDWLNRMSPARSTWNGHNASCYKEFALAVNGFDERMQYGGEDCEFGDRLCHLGLKPRKIRYSTTCLHLDHGRGYVTPEMLEKNHRIRAETLALRRVRSPVGLDRYLDV